MALRINSIVRAEACDAPEPTWAELLCCMAFAAGAGGVFAVLLWWLAP